MNKDKMIRIAVTGVIVMVLALMWGLESDIAYNVAQQRPILLGRYTLEKTLALLIATPILLCVLIGQWTDRKKPADPKAKRLAAFKQISLTVSIILGIVIADVALRLSQRQHYVADDDQQPSYHRVPNSVYEGVFHDRPEFAFSYPNPVEGYPPTPFVLTVDERGFRNPERHEQYDWIVLGDSFAEGSKVSDDQVWTARLAERRGVRLYNLGMSGGNPVTYLDTLKRFGLELRPKAVLYLLYEGNDLRNSIFRRQRVNGRERLSIWDVAFKASPLRQVLKDSLIRTLGPVGRKRFYNDSSIHAPSHRMYPVAWLPFEIPEGSGNGYAFEVKRLEQHYVTDEGFRGSLACIESLRLLEETRRMCEENGAVLIFIYAPDRPHVLIEDMLERVDAGQLRAFLSTRISDLPEPKEFAAKIKEGTQVRERVFRQYCDENGIAFISLTEQLRRQTRNGVQTYYSFDQHWTPDGHEAVANYLSETIVISED
ncbi:MAG TPA: hypothetical protein ENN97_10365 [Phycisphaerales bacterium]|nr:hypothetical protein [Phycisphaerales bacterium]